MFVLGTILARAGSKGLPDKCVRPLLGRPLIEYTFDHAAQSELIDKVVFTTDSEVAAALARRSGIQVIDRPPDLADDTATVDAVARHAVEVIEAEDTRPVDLIVFLYGNIPVRAPGVIDRAVRHLIDAGADSVRTLAPVAKQHPDWVHRLEADRMVQFRANSIYRRQDLEPLYYHDGAVLVVTRQALFTKPAHAGDFHAFMGKDRRGIVQSPEDSVDVDEPVDLYVAEAILRAKDVGWATPTVAGAAIVGSTKRRAEPAKWWAEPTLQGSAGRLIRIGQVEIGDPAHTDRVFIIAEAGVNHNGQEDVALRMVDAAADAGADAVKFQVFTAKALTTEEVSTATYQAEQTAETSQREMLERLELGTESFERIAVRCAERGIAFLATPFSPDDVDRLMAIGAPAIKIASTDIVDVALLERACRASVPLIVSTGAASGDEIAKAVDGITAWGARDRLILLHCVSSYPTALGDANLRAITTLGERFGLPVGFSDHTTSTITGALAVCAGACVLEKHFTLDRNAPGPDQAMSLEPDSLREYVQLVREAEAAMGNGDLGVQEAEREVRVVGRKSIVAARDIAAGEIVVTEALSFKRAGGGLPPTEAAALVGKRATMAIKADTPLTREMVR